MAALFATAVLTLVPASNFCGLTDPVSSLEGFGRLVGEIYPTTYLHHDLPRDLQQGAGLCTACTSSFLPLLIAIPVLIGLSAAFSEETGGLSHARQEHRAPGRQGIVEPGPRPDDARADRLRLHRRRSIRSRAGCRTRSTTRPIAIVDEDQSPLSQRIVNAFQPPLFVPPKLVSREEMDARMDAGLDTFALNIPPNFQQDVLAGHVTTIQLNTDATRVGQAFSGSGYVQTIVNGEVQTWLQRYRSSFQPPVNIEERVRYNPNLSRSWFGAVVALIDQITMLSVLLTGAALIRERERGTVEHLLVMPVTPFEIMTSKVWSMAAGGARHLRFLHEGQSCRACWRSRSRVRSPCSCAARRSTCSPPRRWACSWPPSPARCRSSPC